MSLPDQALVPGLHRILSPFGDADNPPLSHRSSITFTVISTENGPGSKLFPKLNDKAIKIFSLYGDGETVSVLWSLPPSLMS